MGVFHRFSDQVEQNGVPHAVSWLGEKISSRVRGLMYSESRFLVVSCPTRTAAETSISDDGITVERMSGVDFLVLARRSRFVPQSRLPIFRQRLERNCVPFAACKDGQLCGFFWNAPDGDSELELGLTIETTPTRCYAIDLLVDPAFRGQGVACRLVEAARASAGAIKKQELISLIRSNDLTMRHIYLDKLGGHYIGSIATVRVLGVPSTRWELGSGFMTGTRMLV